MRYLKTVARRFKNGFRMTLHAHNHTNEQRLEVQSRFVPKVVRRHRSVGVNVALVALCESEMHFTSINFPDASDRVF